MQTLKEMLIEAGYTENEMDHHESDLYVYVTPLTTSLNKTEQKQSKLSIA